MRLYMWVEETVQGGENVVKLRQITVINPTSTTQVINNVQSPTTNTRFTYDGMLPSTSVFTTINPNTIHGLFYNQTFTRRIVNSNVVHSPTPPNKSDGLSTTTKLAIGLGVGLPLAILLIALASYYATRARRRK